VHARPTPLAADLRAGAPRRYVVKPGDTLWGIAATYLRDPGYWPQLWAANGQITHPDRIYPGEILVLSHESNGTPKLRGLRVEHLSPAVRTKSITQAIPTIPYAAIQAFLTAPRLVDPAKLDNAPYVVSFRDGHLVGGAGEPVYIRGANAAGLRHYAIVRPDGPYKNFRTGKILGQKALPVGRVTVKTFGPVSTGVIDSSDRSVLTGDRLLPIATRNLVRNFYPHAPTAPITAHIISVYGGVSAIGQYDVVTLDAGAAAGLVRGDVLKIFQTGRTVFDPVAGDSVQLPPVQAGQLMIFATEAPVSFALIMRASRAIHVGDTARSPQTRAHAS
jgi:LysM repeat protein